MHELITKKEEGEKFFTSFSFIKENVTVVTSVYYIGEFFFFFFFEHGNFKKV